MMNKFLLLVLAALVLPALASAQTTTVTASQIHSDYQTLLANGYLCLTPVNAQFQPTSFSIGNNGGFSTARQVCYAVANGALINSVAVADTALTTPAIGYLAQVEDATHSVIGQYSQAIYPTGTTWNLDTWTPTATATAAPPTFQFVSATPLTKCTAPSLDYSTSAIYGCIGSTWASLSTGGSTIPLATAGDQFPMYQGTGTNALTPTTLTPSLVGADPAGAAASAQTNAEAYSANASNLSSGTVAPARLPLQLTPRSARFSRTARPLPWPTG